TNPTSTFGSPIPPAGSHQRQQLGAGNGTTEWTRAARSSEIVVQFVVVNLGGTSLRVGDQLFCGFALHPSVEHIGPALKHDLPLGEVAVHVVDGRDPVPGRMGQAHL